ncbi:acetyl-CoA synthetase-like protein [Lichtheimia hyalospora FSU 10163]|nr:acetyl-CoA synthetase-like protein [Lichtheimia hyalospora FSU 10163]
MLIDAHNTERFYTFSDLRNNVRAFAHAILGPSFNLKQGDVVSICSPNDIEYYAAFHGVMAAGCIACPLRAFMTSDEIAALFHISQPKLIIGHPSTVQLLQDALKSYGKELPMLVMATTKAPVGTQLFTDFLKPTEQQQQPLPSISPDSPSHLLSTSGTTGAYKLVATNHRIEVQRTILMQLAGDQTFFAGKADPSVLTCGNFGSSHNIISSQQSWLYGRIPQYVTETMDDEMILHYLVKYQCVTPNMLPSFLVARLVDRVEQMKQAGDESVDLSSLKIIGAVGQPLDPKVIQRAFKILPGTVIMLIFGSTESGFMFMPTLDGTYQTHKGRYTREDDDRFEFKLVDENGQAVPRGCQGELLFRSPMMITEYYNNPEKTAESFDEEGFFRTGDICMLDEHDKVHWLGRASERIKTNNKPVVPKPIEDLCMAFGGIKECAVVGAFSKKRVYELPTAYIVLEDDKRQDQEQLKEAITQYVNERVPEEDSRLTGGVKIISELPRTKVGKVNRFKLRRWAQDDIE